MGPMLSLVCQFHFRCMRLLTHLRIGEVVDGMSVVKAIESVGTGSGTPKETVTIVDSGVVE